MSSSWDELLKMLARANPQGFVSLVSKGTYYLSDITQELITRTIKADFLCRALRNDEEVVIHVEFQRAHDPNMRKRVWEYNCVTSYLTHLPVCSFVIYLWKDENIVEPPYVFELKDGKIIHIFNYENICLWEVSPEILQQKGLEGLLPLLPLTKGADKTRDQIVDDMITGLRAAGKDDILTLGYTIAGRVYETEDDQEWLRRRFQMFHGPLEESWPYREIVQQGLEKGLEQGLKQGLEQGLEQGELKALRPVLIRIVETRFPELSALAKQQAERLTTPEQLNVTIDKLLVAKSTGKAQQALLEGEQAPEVPS